MASILLMAVLLPQLGELLRPFVTEAVVGLLSIAFMTIDVDALRSHLRRPVVVLGAVVWTSFVIPAMFAAASLVFDLANVMPEAYLGLMLQAVASPLMSAPAFALVLGLDATLVLLTLLLSTALVPLTAPLFAVAIDLDLALSPGALALRLAAVLTGSALIGLTLRRVLGTVRLMRWRGSVDGLNILIMFVFASAVMGDLGVQFMARPWTVVGLVALAFAVFALLVLLTALVFAAAGGRRALTIGLTSSLRNMGLLLAGTGGAIPELTWIYFAAAQFPIYLAPLLLQPIVRRIDRAVGEAAIPSDK